MPKQGISLVEKDSEKINKMHEVYSPEIKKYTLPDIEKHFLGLRYEHFPSKLIYRQKYYYMKFLHSGHHPLKPPLLQKEADVDKIQYYEIRL